MENISFLEWHEDGRPHWHLFIETANGQKIGVDQIRDFWAMGAWIREGYFESQKHWDKIGGYFEKNGYFEKEKGYQGKLPKWALDIPGLKIRRWSASNSDGLPALDKFLICFLEKGIRLDVIILLLGSLLEENQAETIKKIGKWFDDQLEIIVDKNTGEILKDNTPEEKEEISYRMRLKSCGQKTWMRISSPDNAIQGIVNIPYSEVRKAIPGHYKDGEGYKIRLTQEAFDYFFHHFEKVEAFESAQARNNLVNAMTQWHDWRISKGHYEYSKVHG